MDEGIGLQHHHALLLALDWVLDSRVPWRSVAQFIQDPEAVVNGLICISSVSFALREVSSFVCLTFF